jgi:3-oxoadipate enol-lactonase
MASAHLVVDGTTIWYEDAGRGPSVVLLNAAGVDSRMWDRQLAPLAERFHIVRFDFPGTGRSPRPESPWAPIELVRGFLDSLDIRDAALVGISLGGGIAVDFAIAHPDRTWALVAVASGARDTSDDASGPLPDEAELWDAVLAGDRERAACIYLDLWAPVGGSEEDRELAAMVRKNVMMLTQLVGGLVRRPEWSAADRLSEIQVPSLVIWGDRDQPLVVAEAERLADGIHAARRVVLPGIDHLVAMRSPAEFTSHVLAFLTEVASRGAGDDHA